MALDGVELWRRSSNICVFALVLLVATAGLLPPPAL